MSWSDVARWWLSELHSDAAYEDVVAPLLEEILGEPKGTHIDLGCGEGRISRRLGGRGVSVVGLDMAETLVGITEGAVVGDIDSCPFRSDSFDAAYSVLVFEHLDDVATAFTEAARIVRSGGSLSIVSNHPMWTAPGSTPIEDGDGEIVWRPGAYHSSGVTDLPVEGGTIRFHHRSMADLLNSAAEAGWALERMIERPHHQFEGQSGILRLVACRWRLG